MLLEAPADLSFLQVDYKLLEGQGFSAPLPGRLLPQYRCLLKH